MAAVRFIHTKPCLSLLLVSPFLLGMAVWFDEQSVDLWIGGQYLVMDNYRLSLFFVLLLGLLALLYRGIEAFGISLSPVIPFLHVSISSFCLLALVGSLNSLVPAGEAIAPATLATGRDIVQYLALLLGAMQILLAAALLYELMRPGN